MLAREKRSCERSNDVATWQTRMYGPYRSGSGHLFLTDGSRSVFLHRVVMEEHLGRKLAADEIVHHRNEDPSDNRLENLEVMTWSAHVKHHHKRTPMMECVCVGCRKVMVRPEREERRRLKNGKAGPFCGKSCAARVTTQTRWDKGVGVKARAACGSSSAYCAGCRCDECKAAHATAVRKWRRQGAKKKTRT